MVNEEDGEDLQIDKEIGYEKGNVYDILEKEK